MSKKIIKEYTEAEIYERVQKATPDYKYENAFVDGDLGERLEEWPYYHKIKDFDLTTLDNEEWELDESIVDDYIEMIKKEGVHNMPPIVIDGNKSIIDGIHRINALLQSGYTKFNVVKGSKKSVLKNKQENIMKEIIFVKFVNNEAHFKFNSIDTQSFTINEKTDDSQILLAQKQIRFELELCEKLNEPEISEHLMNLNQKYAPPGLSYYDVFKKIDFDKLLINSLEMENNKELAIAFHRTMASNPVIYSELIEQKPKAMASILNAPDSRIDYDDVVELIGHSKNKDTILKEINMDEINTRWKRKNGKIRVH
jgi:hypothetical protein